MTAATLTEERPADRPRVARLLVPGRLRPGIAGAVRSLRRRGHAVHCPCCGGDFDRFIAHRGRPFARCPRCGSLERHRLLIGFLRERPDLFASHASVLHIAPEYSLQRWLRRQENLSYRSADLDSPLAMDRVDLLAMPYADGSFEIVICNHVLEHVADDRVALREIRRVLAPGGCAIVMSPIDEQLSRTLEDPSVESPQARHLVFGQSDHLRRYGHDFAARVAAEGFAVDAIRYIDQLPPGEIPRLGLRRDGGPFHNDDIFICRTPD
jgi:SAM-dependent methyltransferase